MKTSIKINRPPVRTEEEELLRQQVYATLQAMGWRGGFDDPVELSKLNSPADVQTS